MSDESLEHSIATFCVLLNRPYWLEPESLKRMMPVWQRLAERHGDFGEPDVMEATETLLTGPTSVLPGPAKVVALAVSIATRRRLVASELVAQFRNDPSMVMYDAINTYERTRDTAALNLALANAISAVERSGVCDSAEEFLALASRLRDCRKP